MEQNTYRSGSRWPPLSVFLVLGRISLWGSSFSSVVEDLTSHHSRLKRTKGLALQKYSGPLCNQSAEPQEPAPDIAFRETEREGLGHSEPSLGLNC